MNCHDYTPKTFSCQTEMPLLMLIFIYRFVQNSLLILLERNIIFTMKSTFIHQYSLNRFLLKNVFCNVTFHLYLNYSYKTWNVFNYEILRFSGFPLWEKIWYVIQLSDKTSYGKDMSVECIHFSKSISVSSSLVNVFKSMTVIWSLLLLEW